MSRPQSRKCGRAFISTYPARSLSATPTSVSSSPLRSSHRRCSLFHLQLAPAPPIGTPPPLHTHKDAASVLPRADRPSFFSPQAGANAVPPPPHLPHASGHSQSRYLGGYSAHACGPFRSSAIHALPHTRPHKCHCPSPSCGLLAFHRSSSTRARSRSTSRSWPMRRARRCPTKTRICEQFAWVGGDAMEWVWVPDRVGTRRKIRRERDPLTGMRG